MPDKFGFNILVDWGKISTKCIEPDCDAGGRLFEWDDDRKKVHFLSHHFTMEGHVPAISGLSRTDSCRVCGRQFEQERKRGRPRVLCYVCKPSGGE